MATRAIEPDAPTRRPPGVGSVFFLLPPGHALLRGDLEVSRLGEAYGSRAAPARGGGQTLTAICDVHGLDGAVGVLDGWLDSYD
jgi:hypothetical protein